MTEPIKEQLSAFLDSELPKAEFELLLKRLGADAELRGSLERYVLMGEALRVADHGSRATREFGARVCAAVAKEGTPAAVPTHRRWSRPLAGIALAAGAAAAAVLVVRWAPLESPDSMVESSARPGIEVMPGREAPQRWRTVPTVSATQLTHYVVAHSEYSSPIERRNVLTGVLGQAIPVNDVVEIEPE